MVVRTNTVQSIPKHEHHIENEICARVKYVTRFSHTSEYVFKNAFSWCVS